MHSINPKQFDRFRDRHSLASAKDDRRVSLPAGAQGMILPLPHVMARLYLPFAALVAMVVVCFAPVLAIGGFPFDDATFVRDNPLLHDGMASWSSGGHNPSLRAPTESTTTTLARSLHDVLN